MTQAHEQYDAIIIGVGQAGNPLATALSQAGWKTAVIERRFVGSVTVSLAEVRRRKQAIVDTSRAISTAVSAALTASAAQCSASPAVRSCR